ncbi:MAG: hypothetical protein P8J27_10420 [Mariniblastus sp.]|nr:hypothetical protein [Mariniblastus sp.]
MEQDPHEKRFQSIEKKLNLLVVIGITQAIVLTVLASCLLVNQFLPSTWTMILLLLLTVVFVYFFRKQIPGWLGTAGRFFFSQLFAAQKSDSAKENW